jgi:hypothetical protein
LRPYPQEILEGLGLNIQLFEDNNSKNYATRLYLSLDSESCEALVANTNQRAFRRYSRVSPEYFIAKLEIRTMLVVAVHTKTITLSRYRKVGTECYALNESTEDAGASQQ